MTTELTPISSTSTFGSYTWAERRAIIRARLEESSEGVWDDDVLLDDFNTAMRELVAQFDPDEFLSDYSFSTVAGQRAYTVPVSSNVHRAPVKLLYGTTALERETPADWAGYDLTSEGVPEAYAFVDGQIYLRPVPSAAQSCTYFYKAWPQPMTSTSDTVPVKDHYLPAVEAYVLAKAYEQVGDTESAMMAWRSYDRAVAGLAAVEQRVRASDDVAELRMAW